MPIGSYPDRVKEAVVSTETASPWDLNGAATGYRTFASVCTSGLSYDCCIQMDDGSAWIVGEFTFTDATPDTLTLVRTYSSDGTFTSGAKSAFIVLPSDDIERIASIGKTFALGALNWTLP